MIVLTPEEHDEWVHMCGKAGRELVPGGCTGCDMGWYCLSEHSVRGMDFLPRMITPQQYPRRGE